MEENQFLIEIQNNLSFGRKPIPYRNPDFKARSSEASLARVRTLTRVMSTSDFARATNTSLERPMSSFRFLYRHNPSLERGLLRSSEQGRTTIFECNFVFCFGRELTGQFDPRHNQRSGNLESINITNFSARLDSGWIRI